MRGKLGGLEAFLHGRTSANLGHLNRNTHPSRDSGENQRYTRTISHKLQSEDFFLFTERGVLRTRCAVLEAYRRARDASRQHHIQLLMPETKQVCHMSHQSSQRAFGTRTSCISTTRAPHNRIWRGAGRISLELVSTSLALKFSLVLCHVLRIIIIRQQLGYIRLR